MWIRWKILGALMALGSGLVTGCGAQDELVSVMSPATLAAPALTPSPLVAPTEPLPPATLTPLPLSETPTAEAAAAATGAAVAPYASETSRATVAATGPISASATLERSVAMTSTATLTPTVPVQLVALPPDPVERRCPNPPPEKPVYNHFYLGGQAWPRPQPELPPHFWLDKPLPGGGRLLITEWLPYGYDANNRYLLHNGVDSAEPLGTPVLAAADGVVVVAGPDAERLYGWRCDWYGNLVVVQLDDEWLGQPVYLLYGHVLEIQVQAGQRVRRGQPLAEVGFGGAAPVPHLHFEVRVGTNEFGSTRNPLLWLAPPPTRGIIAGRLVDPQGRPWQGVTVVALGKSAGASNRTSWTYLDDPQHLINPDERLAENFVLHDLLPGVYEVVVRLQGIDYRREVAVSGGRLSTVEIVTEPYKTPTPAAVESAEGGAGP
ncbi:MAG: peptidoglycan DD-metalloendopeptidase family protein [Candidatus Promineifilaceae bacterium]|nr:peptidoglycan DD-metalloendopeptidase family protein [Candidatus Promineifilaceae bacterium]